VAVALQYQFFKELFMHKNEKPYNSLDEIYFRLLQLALVEFMFSSTEISNKRSKKGVKNGIKILQEIRE
jgi:hypothetical protein